MITQNDYTFREGQSITRPPFFDGNDYPYWKIRIRIYFQSLDFEIWEVICDGPFIPRNTNKNAEEFPITSSEWSELDRGKMSLNSKVMNALFYARQERIS